VAQEYLTIAEALSLYFNVPLREAAKWAALDLSQSESESLAREAAKQMGRTLLIDQRPHYGQEVL
jgi:hypothetical protein